MPSPGAVLWRTGKDPLGPHVLQGRSCRQVVQKRILSESRHWHFPHPNLGRIWTTIPAALLPCKHGSRHDQRFGKNFLLPRKLDGGRLFGQLSSPGLWCRLYGSPDTGGEISTSVRATGHKTLGESSVDITVCSYDTTHLQENPQRLEWDSWRDVLYYILVLHSGSLWLELN